MQKSGIGEKTKENKKKNYWCLARGSLATRAFKDKGAWRQFECLVGMRC